MHGPKYLEKFKPEPGPTRPEKPDLTYNSAPCQKFHSKSSACITTQKYIEINSKCTTVNWQKVPSFTFNTKKMSNKSRCDVSAKQMFHTWMKTLLRREYS